MTLKFKLSKSHERILRKEDALKSFETNVKRHIERIGYGYHLDIKIHGNKEGILSIKQYLERVNAERSFAMKLHKAFTWSETPEGFMYWFDLFDKYYREPSKSKKAKDKAEQFLKLQNQLRIRKS